MPADLFTRILCLPDCFQEFAVSTGLAVLIVLAEYCICSCLWLGLCPPAWLLVASHNFISQALSFQHNMYAIFFCLIEGFPCVLLIG